MGTVIAIDPDTHAGDEASCEDRIGARTGDGCCLDNNTEDKYRNGDQNPVLSRDGLRKESREERAEPGAELEDGGQPALLGLVCT